MKKLALLAACGLIAALAVFYLAAPRYLLFAVTAAQRSSAGLEARQLTVDGASIAYLDSGGDGEPVLLVHGIYAEKDHWAAMAGELDPQFRIIIPDVPGFGDSKLPDGARYSYEGQSARLLAFADALGLGSYHLAGNSMGGTLVGMMAAERPERTLSVSFIGGVPRVDGAAPGRMALGLMRGDPNPMVVLDRDDYFDRFAFLFVEMPFIPGAILEFWAERDAAQAALNVRIWQEIGAGKAGALMSRLERIAAPALVVWCDGDALFDVSGAHILHDQIADSRLHIFEGCGHLPMMERPEASGLALNTFLNDVQQMQAN